MLKTTLRFRARRGPARTAAAWLAAALILGAAPVRADDWADCTTGAAPDKAATDRAAATDKIIAACSAVIAAKQRPPADLAKAYLRRGIATQRTGKFDDAIADFTKALESDPKSSDALTWRGLVKIRAKQVDQAQEDFDRAIEIDPTKAFAYATRGIMWFGRRDWARAIADETKAIELQPGNPMAHLNRAMALMQTGDIDRALADFDRTIALNPAEPNAFVGRGQVYRMKGDLDRAIAELAARLDSIRMPGIITGRAATSTTPRVSSTGRSRSTRTISSPSSASARRLPLRPSSRRNLVRRRSPRPA
jgi:tetratricopeptide (TPR) repeat protein